jgi:signal transduction histidine kinase
MARALSFPLSSSREISPLAASAHAHSSYRALGFRFVALVALVISSTPELHCQAPFSKTVLMLNSYRSGYTWTDDQVRGVRSVLSDQPYPVELYVEYMDTARRADEKHLDALTAFYQAKYGDRPLDLILSTDDAALQFLLNSKDSLFGRKPLVFCGVNNTELAAQTSRDTTTGVIEVFASEELLGLALRLHPGTRSVHVVTDNSVAAASSRDVYARAAASTKDLQLSFLDGRFLTLDQITTALQNLPGQSLVMLSHLSQDRTSSYFQSKLALKRIAEASAAPVYSPSISELGQGIVAASRNGGFEHGVRAAKMAARILNGESPEQIPFEVDRQNYLIFDFAQMKRWGIQESQLPPNASVVNRPPDFYSAYRGLIWGGAAFIALEGLVIALLFINVRMRKRAEERIRTLNADLEDRVQARTTQLELANRELEAFSYSVSHDLSAPLKNISGFIQLLRKRSNGALDEKSERYLGTIMDEAQRLGTIIESLLNFSRLGRAELQKSQVDLNRLVAEVRQQFAFETQDRSIEWRVEPLPQVLGDGNLLKQVFANFLSNAIKYTRNRRQATITVGCEAGNSEEVVLFVRDNGVGFNMKHASKLFGVFQRLHNVKEFEGTGIGLANVQRIIQRHGGRVWVEAEEDQGAAFFCSLPR